MYGIVNSVRLEILSLWFETCPRHHINYSDNKLHPTSSIDVCTINVYQ